jgi:hypothetical protein
MLIGVAVIIGIVLLRSVTSNNRPAGAASPSTSTTTTTKPKSQGTTTTGNSATAPAESGAPDRAQRWHTSGQAAHTAAGLKLGLRRARTTPIRDRSRQSGNTVYARRAAAKAPRATNVDGAKLSIPYPPGSAVHERN